MSLYSYNANEFSVGDKFQRLEAGSYVNHIATERNGLCEEGDADLIRIDKVEFFRPLPGPNNHRRHCH